MNIRHALTVLALCSLLHVSPLQAQEVSPSAPEKSAAAVNAKAARKAPANLVGNIQLSQIRLDEVAKLLSQVGNANVVVTNSVADIVVSLYLREATADAMVRNLCRAAGVWYRYDGSSKTYVIMSAEEYQKDLAIVRDEKTQVFTLRHHNVVATANAIKGLFGTRVALANPVEEMPPVSLGSGNRTSTSGGNRTQGSNNANGNTGGIGSNNTAGGSSNAFGGSGGGFGNTLSGGQGSGGTGGGAGAATASDPRADLDRLSLERLAAQMRFDENGQPVVSAGGIQDLAARLGPPIYVTYNRLNNLLMVRTGDTQSLQQIQQLIADMDRPPKQVLLEMKILEVTLDDGYRSVFDVGIAGGRVNRSFLNQTATNSSNTHENTDGAVSITSSSDSATTGGSQEYFRNSFTGGLADQLAGVPFVWQFMNESLSIKFQLLAQENKLKALASPMLVAANNQPARLFIGDERILTVGASSQSVTGTTGATNTTVTVETEKRDIGQTLSILPRINGDRTISLTVDQDSSTVKIGDASIPISTDTGVINFPIDTVNTANLQVTAHARDGMTVAIGGMIRETTQRDEEKVPLLGDIPGLGFFFKRDVRATVRSQIVLLITPRVIENAEEGAALAHAKKEDYDALIKAIPKGDVLPKPEKFMPQEVD